MHEGKRRSHILRSVDGPGIARLEAMLNEGVVIFVATRDDDLRSHMARAWGGRLDAETGRLDLAVTVYDDDRVVSDLEANGSVAVLVCRPTTYQAMQVTGHVEWIGEVQPTDRQRIDAHIERVVAEAVQVGLPRSSSRLAGDHQVAIRVALDRFFEQTPGARAGSAL